MSFTDELITKLSHSFPEDTCCRLALISAIVKIDGSIHLAKNKPVKLELKISNMALARQVSQEFKSLFGLTPEINLRRVNIQDSIQSQLIIAKDKPLKAALKKLGILDSGRLNFGLPKSIIRRSCCKKYFLRGVFLAGGYITASSKGAHLEIASQNSYLISELSKLLNQKKLNNRVRAKNSLLLLYMKGYKTVISFLKIINAPKEALEFENAALIRHLKNKANRLANAETANASKVIKNAFRQIKEINLIENAIGISGLSKGLQEICLARLQNPQATLAGLGEKMQPRLAKSAVNHRFRRIRQMASQLDKPLV